MVILAWTHIKHFLASHPDAATALNRWGDIASAADWQSFAELKNDFGTADFIGNDRVVFNIKGNDYRLVAMIHFDRRTLYIRFIGTHAAYDKIDCKTI